MANPLITAVIAVYGVESYLPAFLRSLEWQTIANDKIEYIFVNDQTEDNSFGIISEWAAGRENVRVFVNPINSGAAEARRYGYASAKGEWITSIDPDDIIDKDYFANVEAFIQLTKNQNPVLLTTRVLPFQESEGITVDNHPLGYKYKFGDRLVRLSDAPATIQLGATAFVKRSQLEDPFSTFDYRIKPTFEDGSFLANYLLNFRDPVFGLVSSAHYFYRKRTSGESLVQSGWKHPEKYDDQLIYGYLPILKKATYKFGEVPLWLQYTIIYDLSWYFTEDIRMNAATEILHHDDLLSTRLLYALKQVFSYINPKALESFPVRGLPWNIRETLLVYFYPNEFGEGRLTQWRKGDISTFSLVTREDPDIVLEILSDGETFVPELEKVTRHYFGHKLAYETYFKVPSKNVAVKLNGRLLFPVEPEKKRNQVEFSPDLLIDGKKSLARGRVDRKERLQVALDLRKEVTGDGKVLNAINYLHGRIKPKQIKAKGKLYKKAFPIFEKAANQSIVKRKYADAWLIMDRPNSANDNGEHFYRWVKENRPDTNAYFVLSKQSTAWASLEEEGFKLLDYGSLENWLAFYHAAVVISSDAVADVMYHIPRKFSGGLRKPFVFLQHGVTRNDLSTWLNEKRIDLTISTTPEEHAYFISPEGPYTFKSSQVSLSGFSRFDRLYELQQDREENNAKVVLTVMPTWRSQISRDISKIADEKQLSEYVFNTRLATEWRNVLSDPTLLRRINQGELEINFVAHPNLAEIFNYFGMPDTIKAVPIKDIDFQKLLVESDIFVSDFSSTAFDAAIAGCDIAYFQFDRKEMFSGAHTQRPGYFDEGRDGYGPMFVEGKAFLDWLIKRTGKNTLGGEPNEVYSMRKANLRKLLDGKARERTFSAISEMLRNDQK